MSKKNQHNYPKLESRILNIVLPETDIEPLNGDFFEIYSKYRKKHGYLRAKLWLWKQIFKSVPLFIINSIKWSFIMFGNYLKITSRNFKKFKGFSFINLAGFTLGLTAFMLIFLYIRHELSYDRFHENAGNIYRFYIRRNVAYYGNHFYNRTPPVLAPTVKKDFPETINAVRIKKSSEIISYQNNTFKEDRFFSVDPEFFEMFSFPLVIGNKKTALNEHFSLLISEKMSKKYFGNQDPMGKVLKIDNTYDFKITGVFKDVPSNSHIKFDFLAPFQTLLKTDMAWAASDIWGNFNHKTYIQFPDNYDVEAFRSKLPEFNKKYLHSRDIPRDFFIKPLLDIHLHGNFAGEFEPNSEMKYIYIFSAVAVFILLIACFNYINLSTAQSAKRAKEVGLRKVVGADRKTVLKQFLGESFLITAAAMIFSVFLVILLLPLFNSLITGKIQLNIFKDFVLIIFLVVITIVTGLISGSYPAFYLSSFKPVKTLRGFYISGSNRNLFLRNSLVILQFVISIVMIISTIVVFRQMSFIRNTNLGFNHEYILNFPLEGEGDNFITFKNELMKNPLISDATVSVNPVKIYHFANAGWEGKEDDEMVKVYLAYVDFNFIDFYGINIVEGRKFSEEMTTDNAAFILNETAVKEFNIQDPVGKRFSAWSYQGTIIGIMKDYHFSSMHLKIPPLALRISSSNNLALKVKSKISNFDKTISFIRQKHKQFFPKYPFEFSFLDEDIALMYEAERKLGRIFNYFTFIAIFIACLGLYGLTLFMSERRTREIGIRKVFGASVQRIISLFSVQFIKWIVIATVIAFPVGWYAMNKWLSNFAYRINISIEIFLLAFSASLIIVFITVGYQTIKAAIANPVESIRNE